tara:strand:+ start:322 stop:1413 length:1092 start_codon:yes stop_codon:yes gene_type:complete
LQDANYAYQQQCPIKIASQVAYSATNCMDDKWFSLLFCGINVERVGPDFTTATSDVFGDFIYPRTLQAAMPDIDGDGLSETGEIKCYDPIECSYKCRQLAVTSRGGVGLPTACTHCDTLCPVNFLNTVLSLVYAIRDDVMMAIRLAAVCLGSGGIGKCVCSLFRVLEPEWLKMTTDKKKRCEEDPMDLIMETILGTAATMVEVPINGFIDALNRVIGFMGKVKHVCIELPEHMGPRSCDFESDPFLQQAFYKCEDNTKGLEYMCYYKRRENICLSLEKKTAYEALFDIGQQSTDELTSAYAEQFGSTYTTLSPAISQLFENVGTTNQNRDFTELKDICKNVGPGSMGLDKVRFLCLHICFPHF